MKVGGKVGMQVGKEGTWEAEEKKFSLFWVLEALAAFPAFFVLYIWSFRLG